MSIDSKKKKSIIQTACIALAVIVVIIVAAVVIPAIIRGVRGTSESALPDGYVTYNASRYFFRFDHPEHWRTETDSAGFGYMQKPDKGLVVTLVPATLREKNDGEGQPENSSETADVDVADGVSERFYYRAFGEGKVLDSKSSFAAFAEEISKGVLCEDGETLVSAKVASPVEYIGTNEKFYRANVTYTVKADVADENGETLSTEKTYNGEVFVSSRSMAYCSVIITYDSSFEDVYKKFKKDLVDAADSFRFSVFED